MAGPNDDPPPMTNSRKLDHLMSVVDRLTGQVATMNTFLDSHDRRIARTEKLQVGEAPGDLETIPPNAEHPRGGGGGAGAGVVLVAGVVTTTTPAASAGHADPS
jgi:uncharacterized spore protein YtfJ